MSVDWRRGSGQYDRRPMLNPEPQKNEKEQTKHRHPGVVQL